MAFKNLAANDIFISYARKDATTYANGLADELTKKDFSCFTDRLGTDAGEGLPPALLREVRSCRMLVVLCTKAAKESPFVGQEISEYTEARGTTRTVVPVVFDRTVVEAKWYSFMKGIAPEFEVEGELVTGNPSQAVISRIEKSFNYSRSKERLQKYTIGAVVVLSVLLLLIGAASVFAGIQLKAAKAAREEATSQILSANSLASLQVDPELSLLLATKAIQIRDTAQSETALKRALIESHVRTVLRGHTRDVYDAKFSPDGTLVVTASQDGTARVWDVSTGQLRKELKAPTGESDEGTPSVVRVAEFSHGEKLLMTAGGDGIVRVWETRTWKRVVELKVSDRQVNSATFSPDDKRIMTGSGDVARVWDTGTGQLLKEVSGFSGGITDASFSADGKLIVVATGKIVRVIDAATWRRVAEFGEPEPFEEFGATFSRDSRLVVTTGSNTPWVWEVSTKRKIAELQGHTGPVFTAKFSPDGLFVVTVSEDATARVWETENWRNVLVLRGHTKMVFSAAFSPDSKSVVTASEDGTARVWDLSVEELQTTFRGHTNTLIDAEFSPDGKLAVTASEDHTARVWDVSTGKCTAALIGHTGRVSEAGFNRNGSMIVTASSDATARIWEAQTGRNVTVLRGHTGPLTGAEFSPDGKLVVTASEDKTARVWDTSTGEIVTPLKHDDEVRSAEFSPDGKLIITASDFSVWVWDAYTYKNIAQLTMPERPQVLVDGAMKIAKFSPEGSRIVAGNQTGRVGVWDAKGGFLVELIGHTQYLTSISFSKDGKLIVTTSADETARVWDTSIGKSLATLQGPKGEFWNADFSPDGNFTVTANQDNSAWVWDTHSGQVVTQLKGGAGVVNVTKFSPDGKYILTGSRDKRAYLYKCEVCDSPQRLLNLAHSRVTRDLTPEEEKIFSR